MKKSDILVCEISGKRPGTAKERPTEYFNISYDHLIVSNNHDGYETDWEIVDVPQAFRDEYERKHRISKGNAWLAPMNRTYALHLARERGYRYCIQLDDNITDIQLCYAFDDRKYSSHSRAKSTPHGSQMMDDFIEMLCLMLEHSNAGVTGCDLSSLPPSSHEFAERLCYSLFAVDTAKTIPDYWHGDFEDDIDYELRCSDLGTPTLKCPVLCYGKVNTRGNLTGNRANYLSDGMARVEHMRLLAGDVYKGGVKKSQLTTTAKYTEPTVGHRVHIRKIGVITYDWKVVKRHLAAMLKKYATKRPNQLKTETTIIGS